MDNGIGQVGPLGKPPRRIRPPFDVDSYGSVDRVLGESTERWRARVHADRVAALLEALDGVELGDYDRRVIDWLADWDISTIGAFASLFYRARAAGSDGAR